MTSKQKKILSLNSKNSSIQLKELEDKTSLTTNYTTGALNKKKTSIKNNILLTEETKQKVVDYYILDSTRTLRDISNEFKLSVDIVKTILKEYNIDYKTHLNTPKDLEMELLQIVALNPEYTMSTLAYKLNVSRNTISRLIEKHNIDYNYKNKGNLNVIPKYKELDLIKLEKTILNHPYYSIEQLASFMNCSETTINKAIKSNNLNYIYKENSTWDSKMFIIHKEMSENPKLSNKRLSLTMQIPIDIIEKARGTLDW